jgi:hypothetical protein
VKQLDKFGVVHPGKMSKTISAVSISSEYWREVETLLTSQRRPMNRMDITGCREFVARQPPVEQRITTAGKAGMTADERITDHRSADERITDRIGNAPPRRSSLWPAVLIGKVVMFRRWLTEPQHRFTLWAVGMGLAFVFFAGKITLIMALRKWHPFLIAVASFFACGSVACFTAASWSFYRGESVSAVHD